MFWFTWCIPYITSKNTSQSFKTQIRGIQEMKSNNNQQVTEAVMLGWFRNVNNMPSLIPVGSWSLGGLITSLAPAFTSPCNTKRVLSVIREPRVQKEVVLDGNYFWRIRPLRQPPLLTHFHTDNNLE